MPLSGRDSDGLLLSNVAIAADATAGGGRCCGNERLVIIGTNNATVNTLHGGMKRLWWSSVP